MNLKELASDLLLLAGYAACVYGAWQVYEPGAWIFGGLVAMGAGWRMSL